MAIAAPASETTAVADESTRPTLFAPGGPLSTAHHHDSDLDHGAADTAAPPALAPDLFSTQTRDHGEDDGPTPSVDLRDGRLRRATAPEEDGPHSPAAPTLELLDTMATATEAIEYIERARGHLYTLHHLLVRADILFAEVAAGLQAQGRTEEAELLRDRVIGRNVIDDRWSFEVVEAFDDEYYAPVTDTVRDLEQRTVGGRRHARESALKQRRAASTDQAASADMLDADRPD